MKTTKYIVAAFSLILGFEALAYWGRKDAQ